MKPDSHAHSQNVKYCVLCKPSLRVSLVFDNRKQGHRFAGAISKMYFDLSSNFGDISGPIGLQSFDCDAWKKTLKFFLYKLINAGPKLLFACVEQKNPYYYHSQSSVVFQNQNFSQDAFLPFLQRFRVDCQTIHTLQLIYHPHKCHLFV